MNVKIEPSWHQRLQAEFEQPYFAQLVDFVRHEYSTQTCYPPAKLIFNAFNLLSLIHISEPTRRGI